MCRLHPFRHSTAKVRDFGRLQSERDRKAGLEGIAVPDVADLSDVRFDESESVTFDGATPLSQNVIDTSGCRADPLELKVETGGGVVYDVVMQEDGLCLVTFLCVIR